MSHILALSGGGIAGIVFGAIFAIVIAAFLSIVPIKPFFSSLFSGAFVNPFKLTSMRFRKIEISPILEAYIMAKKAGLKVKLDDLEAHFLAGGSCHGVIAALVKAEGAGLKLSFEDAATIDLTTHDIIEVIESTITPRVVEVSDIKSTTKDNFELEVVAKIAVKAKLDKVVGGLGIDVLQNKVSKYIATKISSLADHKNATAYNLAQDILKSKLDADNAYQLLSVDITSINVTRDIGALLAAQDLERIKVQAQIDADRQKNYAAIQEQQQRIKTEEMKASVLEAEAEVPRAIAEAIRDGRFSVMDYYKLMNLQADTAMRRAMMGGGSTGEEI